MLTQEELLTSAQVARLTSYSTKQIYNLTREKKFPQPLRLSSRRLRWRAGDVRSWLISKGAAPAAPEDLLGDLLRRAADVAADPRLKKWLAALADAGEGACHE
jgi:predicted DNA-binding transcriptional regulator AlpA